MFILCEVVFLLFEIARVCRGLGFEGLNLSLSLSP